MHFLGGIITNKIVFTIPEGFGYSGIQKVLVAFCMVTIAVLFPMNRLPAWSKKIIGTLSKYTLAVYCMHNLNWKIYDFYIQ